MLWTDHTHQVGCLVTNLQALETVLRYFLLRSHGQQVQFPKIGDTNAAKTYLTNYTSLAGLVDEYNAVLKKEENNFRVDRQAVAIRDAIAHGRLLTEDEPPYRLWKFGKKKNGRVEIESYDELTLEYLKGKVDLVYRQKQKVLDCFKARGYKGLR